MGTKGTSVLLNLNKFYIKKSSTTARETFTCAYSAEFFYFNCFYADSNSINVYNCCSIILLFSASILKCMSI